MEEGTRERERKRKNGSALVWRRSAFARRKNIANKRSSAARKKLSGRKPRKGLLSKSNQKTLKDLLKTYLHPHLASLGSSVIGDSRINTLSTNQSSN